MSDYYDQIDFRAPLALRKLLVEFSLHCLYYRPDNLYQFAAYYFQRQVELRQGKLFQLTVYCILSFPP